MNITELYINGQLVDSPNEDFTYTFQVNNMFDFENRNTSYSRGIKLPKTSKNLSIFCKAGVPMVKTNAPYQTYNVQYKINGMYIVKRGLGYIKEVTPDYILFWFQDGNINLYNALESKMLYDLPDISKDINENGLVHTKTEDVIRRMHLRLVSQLLYAIGNYGGNTIQNNASGKPIYDFDYCVPAISVLWIFQQIEKLTGKKIECSLFLENDIFNTYMLVSSSSTKENQKHLWEEKNHFNEAYFSYSHRLWVLRKQDTSMPRKYRVKGRVKVECVIDYRSEEDWFLGDRLYDDGYCAVTFGTNSYVLMRTETIQGQGAFKREFDIDFEFTSDAGEEYFFSTTTTDEVRSMFVVYDVKLEELKTITANYLNDFELKNWFKEILTLFSLTPIPYFNKNGQEVYRLATLEERCSVAPVIDWSEKFVEVSNETFLNNQYGKKNIFSYKKYKEDSSDWDYADKTLLLKNEVLKEKATFESTFYAPNKIERHEGFIYFPYQFELWEKEVKKNTDGTINIEYKSKDNRFHLMTINEKFHNQNDAILCRLNDNEFLLSNMVAHADFEPLKWENLFAKHYKYLHFLIDKPSYIKATFNLNEVDIANFDFYSRIYIQQLGAIYMPLKIQYKVGSLAVVELLKIPDLTQN